LAKVEWTAEANRRLKAIHDYVAHDKPGAASHLVQAIYRRVEMLGAFLDLGHRWLERRIPYRVLGSGDIHILGVFHGAMDMARYIE
jgi:plasmid stabilization system protein ParE